MTEPKERAGERALVAEFAAYRKRTRRIVTGLVSVIIAIVLIGGGITLLVFARFDRQEEGIGAGRCRQVLEANFDDQQTKFLDAADTRNTEGRRVARENMTAVNAARRSYRSGSCPKVHLAPIPPPPTTT